MLILEKQSNRFAHKSLRYIKTRKYSTIMSGHARKVNFRAPKHSTSSNASAIDTVNTVVSASSTKSADVKSVQRFHLLSPLIAAVVQDSVPMLIKALDQVRKAFGVSGWRGNGMQDIAEIGGTKEALNCSCDASGSSEIEINRKTEVYRQTEIEKINQDIGKILIDVPGKTGVMQQGRGARQRKTGTKSAKMDFLVQKVVVGNLKVETETMPVVESKHFLVEVSAASCDGEILFGDMLTLLFEPNTKDNFMTLMHYMARHNSFKCFVFLSENIALAEFVKMMHLSDSWGKKPLWYGCKHNSIEIVEMLLSFGADPNEDDSEGNTAVIICAKSGAAEAMQLVIQSGGAFIDHANLNGKNALFESISSYSLDCVKILIECGASQHCEYNGCGPLEFANGLFGKTGKKSSDKDALRKLGEIIGVLAKGTHYLQSFRWCSHKLARDALCVSYGLEFLLKNLSEDRDLVYDDPYLFNHVLVSLGRMVKSTKKQFCFDTKLLGLILSLLVVDGHSDSFSIWESVFRDVKFNHDQIFELVRYVLKSGRITLFGHSPNQDYAWEFFSLFFRVLTRAVLRVANDHRAFRFAKLNEGNKKTEVINPVDENTNEVELIAKQILPLKAPSKRSNGGRWKGIRSQKLNGDEKQSDVIPDDQNGKIEVAEITKTNASPNIAAKKGKGNNATNVQSVNGSEKVLLKTVAENRIPNQHTPASRPAIIRPHKVDDTFDKDTAEFLGRVSHALDPLWLMLIFGAMPDIDEQIDETDRWGILINAFFNWTLLFPRLELPGMASLHSNLLNFTPPLPFATNRVEFDAQILTANPVRDESFQISTAKSFNDLLKYSPISPLFERFATAFRAQLLCLSESSGDFLKKYGSFWLRLPNVMTLKMKSQFIRSLINRHIDDSDEEDLDDVFLNRLQKSEGEVARDFLVAIAEIDPKLMRSGISVSYDGEAGVGNGPVREAFQLVSSAFFPSSDFFAPTPDGTSVHFNLKKTSWDLSELNLIEALGKFAAMSITFDIPIGVVFSAPLMRSCLGNATSTYNDLLSFDSELFKSIELLNSTRHDEAFWKDLDTHFVAFTFEGKEEVLCPGGDKLIVNERNKRKYSTLLAKQRIFPGYVTNVLASFVKGFNSLMTRNALSMCRPEDLQSLISGVQSFDVESLRVHLHIQGCDKGDRIIADFFRAIHAMTDVQRKQLLHFWSGSSAIPVSGFETKNNISWTLEILEHDSRDLLPTASTCTFHLKMPYYFTFAELQNKLLLAIEFGSHGFTQA